MSKIAWMIVLAAGLAMAGCSKKPLPASNSGSEESGDQSDSPVVVGPKATGPTGKGYLATVIRSREVAKRAVSLAALRQIGLACRMYVAQNDEAWPASLEVLVEKRLLQQEQTLSVADKKTPIVYLPPAGTPGAGTVIAYDPALYPGDELNVLMGDGSSRYMGADALGEQLKAQGVKKAQ